MDLSIKYPQFLWLFGTPADSLFWRLVTLRTGVFLIAGFDVCVGVLSLLEFASVQAENESGKDAKAWFSLVQDVVAAGIIAFAVYGIVGIAQMTHEKLRIYRLGKIIELVFVAGISLFVLPVLSSENSLLMDGYSLALAHSVRIFFDFSAAYVIWSTEKRLNNNEIIVILHGPGVAKAVKEVPAAVVTT